MADAYGKELGIAFSEGWRAAIGDQSIVLVPDGAGPVVELTGEPGTTPLDAVRLGVRWRLRRPAGAASRRGGASGAQAARPASAAGASRSRRAGGALSNAAG